MATLADLVVRGRFDHSGIDQGLQQTVRAFNRASKDMRGAFQSRGSFFPLQSTLPRGERLVERHGDYAICG